MVSPLSNTEINKLKLKLKFFGFRLIRLLTLEGISPEKLHEGIRGEEGG